MEVFSLKFDHLRKDSVGSFLVIIFLVAGYSWLVFDIASSFDEVNQKNKEIFFLAMLPILVGIILKGFDRLIGRFFHTNSSDAEKGELALSLLGRFEKLIRLYLSSTDQSAKRGVLKEAASCAKLISEVYDGLHCPY